jgi:hypothetical protein
MCKIQRKQASLLAASSISISIEHTSMQWGSMHMNCVLLAASSISNLFNFQTCSVTFQLSPMLKDFLFFSPLPPGVELKNNFGGSKLN